MNTVAIFYKKDLRIGIICTANKIDIRISNLIKRFSNLCISCLVAKDSLAMADDAALAFSVETPASINASYTSIIIVFITCPIKKLNCNYNTGVIL